MTPVIETVRGLLVGGTPGAPQGDALADAGLLAVVWCVGLAVAFAGAATWAFARRR
ncbi:hypothetical protein [Isoptericola variabilis]|uniref:hypothetical protein n=1 Tax=Isoptericola variabilis TaxID=139208 RepID=UPI0011AD444C|nr:hypothetical protein [Isoptericola variabilis]TWH30205.1 ABC-2 type transport system permease protein [Isoptericola variabilis J7]